MPYARVIVNPAAGAGRTAKVWQQVSQRLKDAGLKFEHRVTEAPGHALELAKSAAKDGCELVVSVGGDGTVNEIVNGLYEAGSLGNTTLGIISTGTGSDYIRTIGIPRHYEEACQRLLGTRRLTVDLGMVEYTSKGQTLRRLFVNFAGLGLDAEIVRTTTQKYKALGSKASYLVGLLAAFLAYRNRKILLNVDGAAEERKVCTVIISNGKYGGGSMLVAPDADPADGLLDVIIIGNLGKPDLLHSLPRIYRGTHLTHPKVTSRKAKEVEIQSAQQVSVQADGELLGQAPARFQVKAAALRLAI